MKYYKIIAIDLGRKQALNVDQKTTQPMKFTGNLDQADNTTMFFVIEGAIETFLNIPQKTVRVLFYQYKMTQYKSTYVKLSRYALIN